jgi:iron complex outermembrane receptor protein
MSVQVMGDCAAQSQTLNPNRSLHNAAGRRSLKSAALTGAALGVLMFGWASSALAQQAPVATAPSSDASQSGGSSATASGSVEEPAPGEIIVTATRRNERLRDVPEAITAVTGAQLAAVGPITNSGDLISSVPGARFNNLGNPLLSEISVRGSGTERATGADSSVGLYVDGVYIGFTGNGGRNFTPIDSFDTEHIEVLEGPQGALYGRDAEYGVINIISQKPTFKNSATVDDVYTFETQQNIATAIVNYAINDNWAVRFGAQDYTQSSGFEYNPTQNNYYDQTKGYIVRGQVRYDAGRLDVDLLAQEQSLRVPSFYSADQVAPANTATGYPGLATYPLGFYQNIRSIPENGADYAREDVDNVSLFVNYDLGWSKLTSSSSWRSIRTTQEQDSDYIDVATEIAVQQLGEKGAYPFSGNNAGALTESYYEDIHLAGAPILDNKLTWLGGFEYLDQPQDTRMAQTGNPCATAQSPNPVIGQAACSGTPTAPTCVTILPGSTCPAVVSPYGSDNRNKVSYYSWAPYASLTYKLPWGFTFSGDLRYSEDHKTGSNSTYELYTTIPYPFLTGGVIPSTTNKLDTNNTTYTVTLSYKLPDSDSLLYTKVGTGYRVGGFNFGHSPPLLNPPYPKGIAAAPNYAPVVPTYNNETSTSYEVGYKGTVAPRTYVTLAAYYQDTLNALAGVMDGCTATNACEAGNTNYTVNAGTVHGSGLEAQFNTSIDLWGGVLGLEVNGSTQTAHYASTPSVSANGEKLNGLPLVGTSIAENPHYLLDTTLNYVRPITNDITGFANLRMHGQWGGIQDPQTSVIVFHMDDYQDLDLRTGIDWKSLEMAVIVRNLGDEFHRNAVFEQAGVNTITGATVPVETQIRPNLPRSVALEVKYRW